MRCSARLIAAVIGNGCWRDTIARPLWRGHRSCAMKANKQRAAPRDWRQRLAEYASKSGAAKPEPDRDLRDEATARQTKPRKAKGETRRSVVALEQLPLFADERSLSEAFLGRGKYTHWRAVVTLLEGRGFPEIDGLMGGRYTRAVRAFFDREYGISGATLALARDGPENLEAPWKKRDLKRR